MSDSRFEGRERVLVPGTLRGYRAWRRRYRAKGESPYTLAPLTVEVLDCWTSPDPRVSFCALSATDRFNLGLTPAHHRASAPVRGCSCGFWATYESDQYRPYIMRKQWISAWQPVEGSHSFQNECGLAHGSIKASGRILLGTVGFRAEKAEIEALWGKGCKATAKAYGVPWLPTREEFVEAFPPPSVDELILERANGPRPGL